MTWKADLYFWNVSLDVSKLIDKYCMTISSIYGKQEITNNKFGPVPVILSVINTIQQIKNKLVCV